MLKTIKQDKGDNCGPVAIYNYLVLNKIKFSKKTLEELCFLGLNSWGYGCFGIDIKRCFKLLGIKYESKNRFVEKSDKFYFIGISSKDRPNWGHFYLYRNGYAYNFGSKRAVKIKHNLKDIRLLDNTKCYITIALELPCLT